MEREPTPCIALPGLTSYCALARLLEEAGLVERIRVDLKCADDEVRRVVDGLASPATARDAEALLRALAQAFPPPFRHERILAGSLSVERGKKAVPFEKMIDLDREARMNNRLKVSVTLKSPEHMLLPGEAIREFISQTYRPMMDWLIGNPDEVHDDFETTLNLLAGEEDVILPSQRTFTLVYPLRDVTNSVRLREVVMEDYMEESVQSRLEGNDRHVMLVESANEAYLHLVALAFQQLHFADPQTLWCVLLT